MRGIVVSPEIVISGKNSMSVNGGEIAPLKLRQYLLYWDQIDFPTNNIMSFAGTPETDYLESTGSMKRSRVSVEMKGELVNLFLQSQVKALHLNNRMEPGRWSLAQPRHELVLDRDSSDINRTIAVELYQSLPAPTKDVPLADILEFKERRKDELGEFRGLIDSLYSEIIISGDQEMAKVAKLDELARKANDIDRLLEESLIQKIKQSLKIQFDYNSLVAGTGAAVLGSLSGNPEAGIIAGIMSSIRVNSEMSLIPKGLPDELKDYAYLYYSQKEFD